jgi:valyl-tRNA synthetase
LIKHRLYSDDEEIKAAVLTRALALFEDMLKIVHPFMPFITEEIWQILDERKEGESISTSQMPEYKPELINKDAEKEIEFVQNVVTAVRNIRGELNIPPSKQINLFLKTKSVSEVQGSYIKSLMRVENLKVDPNLEKPKASASSVIKDCEIFVPLEGLIDLDIERKRIEKEINRLEGLLTGVSKKLANKNFVDKAPADVVEREKAKQRDWQSALDKLKSILDDLK